MIIQKCLNIILQSIFKPSSFSTGFIEGRSVVDNAKIHVGNYYVYNIDLEDFFHSIDQARIWKCMQLPPFYLTDKIPSDYAKNIKTTNKLKSIQENGSSQRLQLANIFSALACTMLEVKRRDNKNNKFLVFKNVLPQGAPTSPILTNVICQKLDNQLSKLAKKFGVRYSRYADDITFSSLHNVYQVNSPFIQQLRSEIETQNFQINENKVYLQYHAYRQEVTGLLVNDKVNVNKKYVQELRMWLYYLEHYGYFKATEFYAKRNNTSNIKKSDLLKVLQGKLNYLKMVKGDADTCYLSLRERLDKLISARTTEKNIKDVLVCLEERGISTAVNLYQQLLGKKIIADKMVFLNSLLEEKEIGKKQSNHISSLIQIELDEITKVESIAMSKENEEVKEKLIVKKKRTKVLPENPSDPRNIARFLNEFNQNVVLKATTHEVDENLLSDLLDELDIEQYDYVTHIEAVRKEFDSLSLKFRVNKGLVGKMNEFLFQKEDKGWSSDIIKIGWSCAEVKLWCDSHSNCCPNAGSDLKYPPCSLSSVVQLHDGSRLSSFNNVISRFKGQIEFRDETDLKQIINRINKKFFADVEFQTVELKQGVRFYSDVEKVAQAYKTIVNMCIDHASKNDLENPKFTISLNEIRGVTETKIILSIHHLNSVYGKTAETQYDRYGTTMTGLIVNQLDGLCDVTLKGSFPNSEYYQMSLWPKRPPKAIDTFNGIQI